MSFVLLITIPYFPASTFINDEEILLILKILLILYYWRKAQSTRKCL